MLLQTQTATHKMYTLSQRLTIIEQLIEELGPQSVLKVFVNDDPMITHQATSQQGNTVHTYELLGSKTLRKTQNINILQKLDAMQKNEAQNNNFQHPKNQALQEISQQQSKQKNNTKVLDQNEKNIYRYFSDNVKCFRCKKAGHHDFACLDEFSCNLCLSSEHHSQKCPQKIVCFRCYNFGHMVNECPQKQDGPFCHNCKRKHFDQCGFLMKGTEQVKQMFIMDGFYYNDEIRCLKCFKFNHFNCDLNQKNTGNVKRPYQAQRNQRKQTPQKYSNHNKKHKY